MSDMPKNSLRSIQHFAEAASSVLTQVAAPHYRPSPLAGHAHRGRDPDPHCHQRSARRRLRNRALGADDRAIRRSAHRRNAGAVSRNQRRPARGRRRTLQQICGNAADRLRRAFGPLELKSQLAERAPDNGGHAMSFSSRSRARMR